MPQPSQPELLELTRRMFDQVPFSVAVIDRLLNITAANEHFEEYFGEWRNRRCYEIYKRRSEPCPGCQAEASFQDGRVRVTEQSGVDRHGRACQYAMHLSPLRDDNGAIRYLMQMSSDLTEPRSWQREYDLFFERVPCPIFVIDREFRVVRENQKFREMFGEPGGGHCYETCKRRHSPCRNCTARLAFADGSEHSSSEVGVHKDGSPARYLVTSTPLSRGALGVQHVMQIGTDVTDVHGLERQLRKTHDFFEALIENSPAGIVAVDTSGMPEVINPAARTMLEWMAGQPPNAARLKQMLPEEFFSVELGEAESLELSETSLLSAQQQSIPVRFSAVELKSGRRRLGRAAFIQDLREIKRLEQQKLDAERLATVGQTVAGLAHTIKNLLTGLEGGMYMVDSGLRRSDAERLTTGWQMLQRNFEKTTSLVKDFLAFAKGRTPELRPTNPNALAQDIVNLYVEAARMQNVELTFEPQAEVRPAPLDPQGIETCVTNLISNAIDAAAMRPERDGKVVLRTREQEDELIFEVVDNGGGMDWEVKGKVFTTFFTTKGTKGTGLGLLTTQKVVLEHGGTIDVDATPGLGSTFRIRLSRLRLQSIAKASAGSPGPAAKAAAAPAGSTPEQEKFAGKEDQGS